MRKKGLIGRFEPLAHSEATPGVVLMLAAALALVAANSSMAHAYHALFHDPLPWSPVARLATLHAWINDAAMALFFFVVGLEIKREVLGGALSRPAARRMPIAAALAGMALPAAVYLAVIAGQPGLARGWAIPAATDIAFALGVLALAGARVPPALRLFLLAVAIVDDLGAVLIIALVYTAGLDPRWLGGAVLVLGALVALNRARIASPWPYALAGMALWFCVLHSGVHATVAGVLAALTVPYRLDAQRHDSLLLRMEHALVPWTGFLIVPLFGFANAGVALTGGAAHPVSLAVGLGLVLGKLIGVGGALLLARRTGFAEPPAGVGMQQTIGVAMLCGIGFTMSLFIGGLAFPAHPELQDAAKLGILGGSLVAALAGFALLRFAPAVPSSSDESP